MAHQYSAAPPYGAQYPTTPYYPPPFAQASGQQMNNASTGFQQTNTQNPPLQSPSSLSNNVRYDANAGIHHQPVPLHFAHLNPEFLKHFPPPLPPPIPPTHFGVAPGNAAGFPHFPPVGNSPHPIPQLGYPPFQQSPAPPGGVTAQEQRSYGQNSGAHEAGNLVDRLQKQIHYTQPGNDSPRPGSSLVRSFDGTSSNFDATMPTLNSAQKVDDISSANVGNQNGSTQHGNVPLQPVISHLNGLNKAPQMTNHSNTTKATTNTDLKERAKAALLSLVPYNIRYDNFLAEGVSSQVLQHLYEELGLNWKTLEDRSTAPISQTLSAVELPPETVSRQEQSSIALPIPTTSSESSTVAKIPPATAVGIQSAVAPSPNMERKDRIAQLLAAKAGKTNASGMTSKSQSPASAAETPQLPSSDPETVVPVTNILASKGSRALAQTEIVKQKMEQLRKEAKDRTRSMETHDNTAILQDNENSLMEIDVSQAKSLTVLPTPIREQLVQSGLSSLIPGLFMTSADPEDDVSSVLFPQNHIPDSQQIVSASTNTVIVPSQDNKTVAEEVSPRLSRKRSMVDDSAEEYRRAKRQTTHVEDSADVPMEVDEDVDDSVSEGEIAEDEPALPDDREYHPEKPFFTSLQTKATDQEYRTKQTEIDAMRRRIAEMEQRQNNKRGQSLVLSPTGSATTTPTQTAAPQTGLSSPPSKMSDHSIPSTNPNDRMGQSPRPLVKATPKQIAERAAQLKADFLRQRALRQKQLQEGIPALNDQVTKTQMKLKDTRAKLAQIHAEMREYEAGITRARKSEEQILQDIEHLEKQISEGVSGQKQFSNELNDLKQQNKPDTIISPMSTTGPNGDQQASSLSNVAQKPTESHPQTVEDKRSFASHDSEISSAAADPHPPNRSQPDSGQSAIASFATEVDVPLHTNSGFDVAVNESEAENTERNGFIAQNHSLSENSVFGLEQVEEEADDSEEAMEESEDESADSHMSIDEESNDSASMSDSGSDEYEPAEPESSEKLDEKMESDEYEPDIDNGQQYDDTGEAEAEAEAEDEDEGDDYEPAENLSPLEASDAASTPTTNQTSSAPHPINESVVIDDNLYKKPLAATQVSQATEESRVDDQEKGLQLSEADTLTKAQNMPSNEEADGSQVLGATEPSSVRYAPYQSPLSSFKSYRFHPSFNKQVKDGYRSLTYSHKIDSKMSMCPTELEGTLCTDPECQEQHFGSMALTDDKILVQMSSASDIKDKALREQYLIGLKKVIARLRQDGVKEFTAVADALSQYRRDWTVAQIES